MEDNKYESDEEMFVELELDEGTAKCSIVTIFDVGEKSYIALLPLDCNDEPIDGNVWLYEYIEDENDPDKEPEIKYIEDDEEYEMAADAFDEYLDNQEFDEIIDEDE